MKIYDTFNDNPEKMPQMEELDIIVRDLSPGKEKYSSRYVKAILSSDPKALPDADDLLIRFQRGLLFDETWKIKIVKELGEYKLSVATMRT